MYILQNVKKTENEAPLPINNPPKSAQWAEGIKPVNTSNGGHSAVTNLCFDFL